MNENKYKNVMHSEVSASCKRAAPEKSLCDSNYSLSIDQEILKGSSNKKTVIQPKHFVFPETAIDHNEPNEVVHCSAPYFSLASLQEQRSPSNILEKRKLSMNIEIPSPRFGIGCSLINSPIIEYDCSAPRDTILISPISAWLLSPLEIKSCSYPHTPSMDKNKN